MRHLMLVLSLLTCLSTVSIGATEEPGTKIAPAFRAERHFAAGASYLENLAPGWEVRVDLADGASFELAMREEGLELVPLPKAKLSSDKEVRTPLGYVLRVGEDVPRYLPRAGLTVEVRAPNDALSYLCDLGGEVVVIELDGRWWSNGGRATSWRLPDGSRLDELPGAPAEWELTTLGGQRFRLDVSSLTWRELPPLNAPVLLEDLMIPFLQGDGDDWVFPKGRDHIVTRWGWVPGVLSVDDLLERLSDGPMRDELNLFFNNVEVTQEPSEMAAYLLGQRLALSGGDRVTFVPPEGEPVTVYLLPGPADPDALLPKLYDPRSRLRFR